MAAWGTGPRKPRPQLFSSHLPFNLSGLAAFFCRFVVGWGGHGPSRSYDCDRDDDWVGLRLGGGFMSSGTPGHFSRTFSYFPEFDDGSVPLFPCSPFPFFSCFKGQNASGADECFRSADCLDDCSSGQQPVCSCAAQCWNESSGQRIDSDSPGAACCCEASPHPPPPAASWCAHTHIHTPSHTPHTAHCTMRLNIRPLRVRRTATPSPCSGVAMLT